MYPWLLCPQPSQIVCLWDGSQDSDTRKASSRAALTQVSPCALESPKSSPCSCFPWSYSRLHCPKELAILRHSLMSWLSWKMHLESFISMCPGPAGTFLSRSFETGLLKQNILTVTRQKTVLLHVLESTQDAPYFLPKSLKEARALPPY